MSHQSAGLLKCLRGYMRAFQDQEIEVQIDLATEFIYEKSHNPMVVDAVVNYYFQHI